jgi:hypothetical protein
MPVTRSEARGEPELSALTRGLVAVLGLSALRRFAMPVALSEPRFVVAPTPEVGTMPVVRSEARGEPKLDALARLVAVLGLIELKRLVRPARLSEPDVLAEPVMLSALTRFARPVALSELIMFVRSVALSEPRRLVTAVALTEPDALSWLIRFVATVGAEEPVLVVTKIDEATVKALDGFMPAGT